MSDYTCGADERIIRLIASEIPLKTGRGTFTAFQAVQKDKKLIDCRFTRDCTAERKPSESCYIRVNVADINIDRRRLYPTLWVKKIIEILPLVDSDSETDKPVTHNIAGDLF